VTSSNSGYSGAPSGYVTLLDGGVPVGGTVTALNSSGIATLTGVFLTGVHALSASFVPSDPRQLPSTSSLVSVLVTPGSDFPAGRPFYPQTSKLDEPDAFGPLAPQENLVALSADGNTMLLGAPFDTTQTGAAWVFTRQNGAWTQQAKLTPLD